MTAEQLKRYLDAIEKVRSERSDLIDAETRQAIAREIGVSDEELAAARAEGEADLTRADGFVQAGLLDDAIGSFEEADALLPDDPRVLSGLARALERRRRGGDAARAGALARRCLELDPRHEPSFAVLRALSPPPAARRGRSWRWLLAGVVLLGGGVAGVTAWRSARRAPSTRCAGGERTCTVPAELRLGPGLEEIAFEPAVLNVSPDNVQLDAGGRLTHGGETELELLRLHLTLLDGEDRPLGELVIDAMPAFAPPLRPGDSYAFHASTKVPPATTRLRVAVAERRAIPGAGTYGGGTPIALSFEPAAPSHVAVNAAWRSRTQRFYEGKSTIEGVIEITNAGSGPLRQLDLELRALDEAGAQVGDGARGTIAYSHMLPMLAGERRLYRAFVYVTGHVAGERLVVTQSQ